MTVSFLVVDSSRRGVLSQETHLIKLNIPRKCFLSCDPTRLLSTVPWELKIQNIPAYCSLASSSTLGVCQAIYTSQYLRLHLDLREFFVKPLLLLFREASDSLLERYRAERHVGWWRRANRGPNASVHCPETMVEHSGCTLCS